MKKLFVLLVLVVAMVAAPLFAEVGAQSWAGDFSWMLGGNLKDSTMATYDNDMDISVAASVGEITSFSVSIDADYNGTSSGTGAILSDGALVMDEIEMTQDFSSFIGNDLTLKVTTGYFKFDVTEYEDLFDMSLVDATKAVAAQATVGVGPVTFKAIVAPQSLENGMQVAVNDAFEVIYASDPFSMNVAYANNATAEKGVVEGGLKVVVSDFSVYGNGIYDMDKEGVSLLDGNVAYAMAPLTVKAGYAVGSGAAKITDMAKGLVKGAVEYAFDGFTPYVSVAYDLSATEKNLGVDAGVVTWVDTVKYIVAVTYDDVSTYNAAYGFADSFGVSFKMDVDF